MGPFRAWLERIPITDPVERRIALTVQVLALVGLAWVLGTELAGFTRLIADPGHLLDLTAPAMGVTLLATLVLVRRGRFRLGLRVALVGLAAPVAWTFTRGAAFSAPLVRLGVLVLAVAALTLGRRTVWITVGVLALGIVVGGLRDQGLLGGPETGTYVPPLGTVGAGVLTLFVAAAVLDALGHALWQAARAAVRQRAELAESEERFRVAFALNPDAVNLSRMSDGVYMAMNEGFTRLTGWTEAEIVGHTAAERQLWADEEQRARLVERLAEGVPIDDVECTFRHKDGHLINGLISSRRITVAGNRYLLSFTRDVTTRKRVEAERLALEEQLRQSQKLEAIGRLAGGVAHDFNNILTSILASADLMSQALDPDHPARADAAQVRQDALRAAELTKQLLAFARRQVIEPRVVRVDERTRAMEPMIRRVVGEAVQLATRYPQDCWPAFIDPSQLEQVILNLAVNARDAMPGGGRLTISTENITIGRERASAEVEAGDYVALTFADTGAGMEPDVIARIFEPFFSTKGTRGVGLGLATCYGIVKRAGGAIRAESVPGAGATFCVYLPRTHAPAEVIAKPARALGTRGTETVLLVEDDESVRLLASRVLASLGYEILEACSLAAADALIHTAPGHIDAAVLDLALPDGSGRDVAEVLAAVRPETPVLFVSGYAGDLVAPGGLGPSVAFLPKPYTPEQLARRLRALIDAGAPAHVAS